MMTGEVLTGGMRDAGSMGGGSRAAVGVTLRTKLSSPTFTFALLIGGNRPPIEGVVGADETASAISGDERAAGAAAGSSEAGRSSTTEEVTFAAATLSEGGVGIARGCEVCPVLSTVRRASTIFSQVTDELP